MSRSQTLQAIVLRTYDVGEADRFCILFTHERGRLAARANGVRKVKSRMGGSLLPLSAVTVGVSESRGGILITSAQRIEALDRPHPSLRQFAEAEQGIELLLALTENDEPMPALFEATLGFLAACAEAPQNAVLAYRIVLLRELGLLPSGDNPRFFADLTDEEKIFLQAAREGRFLSLPKISSARHLRSLTERFLGDHLRGPLKSAGVSAALMHGSPS
ncbi:MAG: DNA repair protein RecO [Candidatus Peregrinibacteria bacterium]|nr:DNA repair protein RecO [Candidatus Peregrinibacteria bacterium]